MSSGMVAENIIICLSLGQALKMYSMSSMNPMSSILSDSSMTTTFTPERSRYSLSMRSLTLPGVPAMTSAPCSSSSTCLSIFARPSEPP